MDLHLHHSEGTRFGYKRITYSVAEFGNYKYKEKEVLLKFNEKLFRIDQ